MKFTLKTKQWEWNKEQKFELLLFSFIFRKALLIYYARFHDC